MKINRIISQAIFISFIGSTAAQTEDPRQNIDPFSMSLDELMNVDIYSASKVDESQFDSPLSTTILTRDEILQSGATTITDALRLVPGLLVWDQTNGHQDTHIRGTNNMPQNSFWYESANSITLVMVDDRVVYNYFIGGTFWETLGVRLSDIQKIEVIRGASATLFGPNAVAGVIHIFTQSATDAPERLATSAEVGSFGMTSADISYSSTKGKQLDYRVSAYASTKNRTSSDYYQFSLTDPGRYVRADSVVGVFYDSTIYTDIDHPERALLSGGINLRIDIDDLLPGDLRIQSGYQDVSTQKIFYDNLSTPITSQQSTTASGSVRYDSGRFLALYSILSGEQIGYNSRGWKADQDTRYMFTTQDLTLETVHQLGSLRLRPGFYFRSAKYDAEFLEEETSLTTTALTLHSDFSRNNYRIVAALRADRYSNPSTPYLSYELVGSWKPVPRLILRSVLSRANRTPSILETFLDQDDIFSLSYGNPELELLTMDLYELGARYKIDENFRLDVEAYYSPSKNFAALDSIDTDLTLGYARNINRFEILPLTVDQIGITTSLRWVLSTTTFLKGHFTLQQTRARDDGTTSPNEKKDNTPNHYYGLSANQRWGMWNLNASIYGYGAYKFSHRIGGIATIDQKAIFNIHLRYAFDNGLGLAWGVRNLLNDRALEFPFADRPARMFVFQVRLIIKP